MSEEDFLEILAMFMPETLEGWLAIAVLVCAFLAVVLPRPAENCHPAWRIFHRAICVLGMGAGKLRTAGKIGRLGNLLRRKK